MAKQPFVTAIPFSEFLEDNIKTLTDKMEWMKTRTFKYAESIEEVRDFVDRAIQSGTEGNPGRCALDLETTGLNTRMKNGKPLTDIVGVGLCFDPKFGLYIPVNHKIDPELNLPEQLVLEEVRRLCASCITVYHNAKFDTAMLRNRGILIRDYSMLEDTQILGRLHDTGRKEINLKILAEQILNQPMLKLTDLTEDAKRFDFVSPKTGYIYGASDAICTLDLFNFYIKQPIIIEQMKIYNLEKRVIFIVMEIESNLIRIDVPYLTQIKTETEQRIKEIEKEIHAFAGRDFNIGSPIQLGNFLFKEKGYRYPEKKMSKKENYLTNNAVFEKIEDEYPIVKKIMEYRGLEKSLSTYTLSLLANHDEENCIKLGFNQSGTDTGRFSSPGGMGINEDGYSGCNVQSIPKDTSDGMPDMRRAFIPRPGKKFVAIDYENEEMRIATNLSNETVWIEAIKNGIDFHTSTAAAIFKVDPKDVTPAQRKIGKTVNFLSMYGGGSQGLSAKAKMSEMEARRTLSAFFAGVPHFKKWRDDVVNMARKEKCARTAFGRIRDLKNNYNSGSKELEAHADRCAPNHSIQGVAADIMKTIMSLLHGWIHRNNLEDDIKMLVTMHDEIVFEISEEMLEMFVPEISKIMMLKDVTDRLGWPVPLTVDVKYGDSWRVKKKFFEDFPHTKDRLYQPLLEFDSKPVRPAKPVEAVPTQTVTEPVKEELKPEAVVVVPEVSQPAVEVAPETPPAVLAAADPILKDSTSMDVGSIQDLLSDFVVPSAAPQVTESILDLKPEAPAELSLIDPLPGAETDIKKNFEKEVLIYTIRDRRELTLRNMSDVISFLKKEKERNHNKYMSDKKILRLRDPEGNILNVEELKVNVDVFLGLARFFEL
jgi:DNA polymerase I-like protein with 3'-5' exonuclease and polymerase domains